MPHPLPSPSLWPSHFHHPFPPPPLVQIYFSYPAIIFTKTILSTHLPALDAIMSSVTHQLMIYKYNRLLRVNIPTFFTNLFSSCSPNWKMRRETGDGGRGWRGRKRDILKRIRSHGIDRGSNLFAIFSSHNLPCGGLGVPLSFYFNCFFNPNFNFRPQPCFRGFEIMLSKCKFAFSQPYSLHHPSLSTDQPPPALS